MKRKSNKTIFNKLESLGGVNHAKRGLFARRRGKHFHRNLIEKAVVYCLTVSLLFGIAGYAAYSLADDYTDGDTDIQASAEVITPEETPDSTPATTDDSVGLSAPEEPEEPSGSEYTQDPVEPEETDDPDDPDGSEDTEDPDDPKDLLDPENPQAFEPQLIHNCELLGCSMIECTYAAGGVATRNAFALLFSDSICDDGCNCDECKDDCDPSCDCDECKDDCDPSCDCDECKDDDPPDPKNLTGNIIIREGGMRIWYTNAAGQLVQAGTGTSPEEIVLRHNSTTAPAFIMEFDWFTSAPGTTMVRLDDFANIILWPAGQLPIDIGTNIQGVMLDGTTPIGTMQLNTTGQPNSPPNGTMKLTFDKLASDASLANPSGTIRISTYAYFTNRITDTIVPFTFNEQFVFTFIFERAPFTGGNIDIKSTGMVPHTTNPNRGINKLSWNSLAPSLRVTILLELHYRRPQEQIVGSIIMR
jgi:hypothetical protein